MPKLINGDEAFSKITEVMQDCTARKFRSAAEVEVAPELLKRCAQIALAAPEAGTPQLLLGRECKQWGRLKSNFDTDSAKLCAVGGYMTGPNGYCHFGRMK